MELLDAPRNIDPTKTFLALVDWIHDEVIVTRGAPGLLVGLSGTDSLVVFFAAAYALQKAGKLHRLMGVHFAPSEDFLYDHPEAETHLWFSEKVIPHLRSLFPEAKIVVDTTIDWRHDGLRWGALMDMSVVSEEKGRALRLPEDQYWLVGTRNRTEDILLNYSNASTIVSLQPIIHLWKSEILKISEYLSVPKVAIDKSCETDCICGRDRLAAHHIAEVDWILMNSMGDIIGHYLDRNLPTDLRLTLTRYIKDQMVKGRFKLSLPYIPSNSVVKLMDPLVAAFEDATLNLKEFNHRQHLYVAWYYLREFDFDVAVERYIHHLNKVLDKAGQAHRFSETVTRAYFAKLQQSMQAYPTDNFNELLEKSPTLLMKSSA